MPTQVQFRRGTTAQNNSFTGAAGELSINTSNNTIRVHDGSTSGGFELAKVSDITTAVANLIDAAPGALDTLNELAAAINDDANFATTIVTQLGNKANTASLTTANVSEVTNLYFSNARVYSNVITIGYATNANVALKANVTDLTTANVAELNNLYYTNARVFAAVTGNLALKANVTDLTTANVIELNSLYFTDARARQAISSSGCTLSYSNTTGIISFSQGNTDTINEGSTNLYYTNARVFSAVTGNLALKANLTDKLNVFAATTSSELSGIISDETGSGALVFGTSPAISTSLTTPSASFNLVNATATTVNFAGAGTTISIGAATGTTTVNNSLTVSGNLQVSGTTTTVNSTTLEVADKNITIAKSAANSAAADGAGITVDGASATFNYVHGTTAWTSSQDLNLASNKAFMVAGTSVLSGSALGTGVTSSSLTSFGNSPTFTGTITAAEITASGNVTSPFFYSQSDINLKKDLVHVTNALDIVNRLDGYWFKWKSNDADSLGMIAQHVESVLPMLIGTSPDGSKTIQYNGIIAILLEAIKAQQIQIDEIKAKLDEKL